jgi:hypothetical protein
VQNLKRKLQQLKSSNNSIWAEQKGKASKLLAAWLFWPNFRYGSPAETPTASFLRSLDPQEW